MGPTETRHVILKLCLPAGAPQRGAGELPEQSHTPHAHPSHGQYRSFPVFSCSPGFTMAHVYQGEGKEEGASSGIP